MKSNRIEIVKNQILVVFPFEKIENTASFWDKKSRKNRKIEKKKTQPRKEEALDQLIESEEKALRENACRRWR